MILSFVGSFSCRQMTVPSGLTVATMWWVSLVCHCSQGLISSQNVHICLIVITTCLNRENIYVDSKRGRGKYVQCLKYVQKKHFKTIVAHILLRHGCWPSYLLALSPPLACRHTGIGRLALRGAGIAVPATLSPLRYQCCSSSRRCCGLSTRCKCGAYLGSC